MNWGKRTLIIAAAVLVSAPMVGSRPRSPTAKVPRFVYVANGIGGTISIYSVDPTTGRLRANGYVASGFSPTTIAIDPTGRFAYSTDQFGGIWAYTANSATGALTKVQGSPFAGGTDPSGEGIDPSGSFLYTSNWNLHNVIAYSINRTTGVPTAVGSPYPVGNNNFSLAMTSAGRFLYTPNYSDNTVWGFKVDAQTGGLSGVPGPLEQFRPTPSTQPPVR